MDIRPTKVHEKIKNKELEKAIKHFGNVNRLAKALGIRTSSIYGWESVPELRARQIEDLTDKKIKKEKLAPAVFGGEK